MTTERSTKERPPARWVRPAGCRVELETERLRIRPWRESDAEAAYELVCACGETLRASMSWADRCGDRGGCEAMIRELAACHGEAEPAQLAYGFFERGSGAPCGGAALHTFRPETAQARLGYWLDPARRGQGLCTEGVRAVMGHALRVASEGGLGLRRIEVRCAASNEASRGVAERLGLRLEGRLREERRGSGGRWEDGLLFAVLAEEWNLR